MTNAASLESYDIQTLPQLFRARLDKTPDAAAYRHFDLGSKQWVSTSWSEVATEVARWQQALKTENLEPGARVAIMLKNCREWVVFEQAALGLGLVVVPLYPEDRPDNVAYIVKDAEVKLLLVEGRRQWKNLASVAAELEGLQKIVSVNTIEEADASDDKRLVSLADWRFGVQGSEDLLAEELPADELATIVYTSGTTGRPKGVMLSHKNIVSNVKAIGECIDLPENSRFLSFLPLSHMFERTGGYYLAMLEGGEVAYARSIPLIGEDLMSIKPHVLISVPRIYEKIYAKIMTGLKTQPAVKQKLFHKAVDVGWAAFEHQQGRAAWSPKLLAWPALRTLVGNKVMARLGGEMTYAICGGAALPPDVAKVFVGLGMNLLQGYGMTESSPVVTVNRPDDNIPHCIGTVVPGVEIKTGEKDELLIRGDSVMMGYWNNEEATKAAIDEDGWLHSGDQVRIDEQGHVFITGRLKEIIVLGNGEKVPPTDMEMAITMDPLIEQIMVVGEGRAFLSAVLVLSPDEWAVLANDLGVDAEDSASLALPFVEKAVLARVGKKLKDFPGYTQLRRATLTLEQWTVENGLLTPTLKVKRPQVTKLHSEAIEGLYSGRHA